MTEGWKGVERFTWSIHATTLRSVNCNHTQKARVVYSCIKKASPLHSHKLSNSNNHHHNKTATTRHCHKTKWEEWRRGVQQHLGTLITLLSIKGASAICTGIHWRQRGWHSKESWMENCAGQRRLWIIALVVYKSTSWRRTATKPATTTWHCKWEASEYTVQVGRVGRCWDAVTRSLLQTLSAINNTCPGGCVATRLCHETALYDSLAYGMHFLYPAVTKQLIHVIEEHRLLRPSHSGARGTTK